MPCAADGTISKHCALHWVMNHTLGEVCRQRPLWMWMWWCGYSSGHVRLCGKQKEGQTESHGSSCSQRYSSPSLSLSVCLCVLSISHSFLLSLAAPPSSVSHSYTLPLPPLFRLLPLWERHSCRYHVVEGCVSCVWAVSVAVWRCRTCREDLDINTFTWWLIPC